MPERERPTWLKVVGGKDHTPEAEPKTENAETASGNIETATAEDLVNIWIAVTKHLPADYNTLARGEQVNQIAKEARGWYISDLHAYLSRHDIWHRPARTKAVIEEVRQRMILHNFSPREWDI